ncbi:hypothetical protein F5B22DRAFT_533052 [Xylaria bambusicola]|uniref:uncharacterized protein n=1 Tax=Xylaria bambusicola TaxID=326684 RepID=UPI002007720C|nr:uncharacterized protein F5B22DRAFT_533052 [Xylaria bambusicola]KAI0505200.1 hypothetical protein F5B22DRAFT_533052 [Xylaria bambusicola]
MDPLSVAASIVGLLAAGGKVTSLLFTVISKCQDSPALARGILFEVADISAALGQLQDYLSNRLKANSERGNLIMLDQLLTTLTGCVTTYSDIQFILTGLNINEDMRTFDRIRWMREESRLNTLVQRLQSHKSSLTLMLTIVQCHTMEEAQSCTQKLCTLVEQMLVSNQDLSERIRGLEREGSILSKARSDIVPVDDGASTIRQPNTERASVLETENTLVRRFAFEDDLESSRAYNKAVYRFSQASITSTALYTTALSVFSKLSLSQVSSISFYALPVCASDLHNSELYVFGEEGATFTNPRATPATPQKRPASPGNEIITSYKDILAESSPSLAWPRSAPWKRTGLLGRFAAPRRRPSIYAPENPVHIYHVGYDSDSNQFTVR